VTVRDPLAGERKGRVTSGWPELTLGELEAWARRLAPGGRLTDEVAAARLAEVAAALREDERAGARVLGAKIEGWVRRWREECRRVAELVANQASLCPPGAGRVAGVDEAGRGPLAGPVVAAAVILRPGAVVPGLDDSKKIDEDRREELYGEIIRASLTWGVGVVGTALVDRLNVLEATRLAMRRAVARLTVRPDYVLVDGWPVPDLGVPHRGVVDGDALCASVAAASVVAKVTRDRIMRCLGRRFPAYGFERNKGYGTPEHREALRRLGPCPAHRRTFLGGALGPTGGGEEGPSSEGEGELARAGES